ncbi:MAG: hypothetical protein V2A55_01980 [Candidatus Jorgensenbacteria bacterium]
MSEDPKKIIANLINQGFKDNALSGGLWRSSAEQNEYLANMLYKRYAGAFRRHAKRMKILLGRPKFSKEKIIREARDMTLHRYVLMFHGLALECYLKAYIAENKKIKPLIKRNKNGNWELQDEILIHNLKRLLEISRLKMKSADVKAPLDSLSLINLERAIRSGKYGIERNADFTRAYTADLDRTVVFARKVIQEIKDNPKT